MFGLLYVDIQSNLRIYADPTCIYADPTCITQLEDEINNDLVRDVDPRAVLELIVSRGLSFIPGLHELPVPHPTEQLLADDPSYFAGIASWHPQDDPCCPQ